MGCSAYAANASSYQFPTALNSPFAASPATEAGSRPGRRVTFLARTRNVTQRMRPDCLRPCGFASEQTCATHFRLRCRKTRFALRAPLRQVAANSKTKHWHSAVPMPAARTACRRRRHTGGCGCGRPARVLTKLASSAYLDCGSSYQFHKEAIWLSTFGIAPFAHACDGKLLGWLLHRRVQQLLALTCGRLFERSGLPRSELGRTAPRA